MNIQQLPFSLHSKFINDQQCFFVSLKELNKACFNANLTANKSQQYLNQYGFEAGRDYLIIQQTFNNITDFWLTIETAINYIDKKAVCWDPVNTQWLKALGELRRMNKQEADQLRQLINEKTNQQLLNDEYVTLLCQSISGLLIRYLGASKDLSDLPSVESEPIDFARSLSRIFSQLETIQIWAVDKKAHLNCLATLDKTTKEQALWALPPCPLSLVEIAQLLQQLNAPALGDIGRAYIPSLLVGVASILGNLLHSAMYLIALHSRATNQTRQAMPTEDEIWQSLRDVIMRFTAS